MDVKEVTVNKGVTVSVGRYESVRIDVALKIRMGKTDDSESICKAGYKIIDGQINDQLEEIQDIIKKDSVFIIEKQSKPKTNSRRRG